MHQAERHRIVSFPDGASGALRDHRVSRSTLVAAFAMPLGTVVGAAQPRIPRQRTRLRL